MQSNFKLCTSKLVWQLVLSLKIDEAEKIFKNNPKEIEHIHII